MVAIASLLQRENQLFSCRPVARARWTYEPREDEGRFQCWNGNISLPDGYISKNVSARPLGLVSPVPSAFGLLTIPIDAHKLAAMLHARSCALVYDRLYGQLDYQVRRFGLRAFV